MENILFVFICFLSLAILYKLFGSVASPAFVFGAVWSAGILLHAVFSSTFLPDLLPVSTPILALYIAGIFCFGFGAFLSELVAKKHSNYALARKDIANVNFISLKLRLILVGVIAVILPFYVQKAISIVLASEIDNFLMGLRWELTYGDADYGWYKYIITLSIIVYAYCLIASITQPSITNRIITILAFFITVTYVVLFTGRTLFLMILLIYLFVNYFVNPRFSFKKLLWIIPISLVLFVGFGLFFNKGGSLDETLSENLKSSTELLAVYLVGALSAFQYEVSSLFAIEFNGMNSLRFFYVIAEKFGYNLPPDFKKSLVQEFVAIPYETNVFTYYSPYVRDFGFFYPLACLVFFGYTHTALFLRSHKTLSPRLIIYCSLLMYPVVMSIFSDQYFSLLSTWLQTVFIVELIAKLDKLFIIKKISQEV
jgi:oligosaccharide repeat unit polymerase